MNQKLDKTIKLLKENKWIHYIVILIIGIIISVPLANIQVRDTHDGYVHILRVIGTEKTLNIGQIPPIINQDYCNGSGYSMNLFYPPIVTYGPLLIKFIINNYTDCLKIFAAISIIISGITMYHFTYQVTKKRIIALLSAIFYMIAPYKLANVYKRFAIGEFTAAVFIPYVFLGLYNLFNQDGKKHYYIAIGAIGLMFSHTVTTLYTAIFSIIYIIFNAKTLKDKNIIKKCIINIAFILLITMLFWMPLLEATSKAEYAIMNDSWMRTTKGFTSSNTILLSELIRDIGKEDATTYRIGIPTIIILLITVLTFKRVDKKYKDMYILSILLSVFSIFMTSMLFPWKIMPNIICKLQYPWRMLTFSTFFFSFICGINLYIILKKITKKDILRILYIIIFIITCIVSSISIMTQFFDKNITRDEKYVNSVLSNIKISHLEINREYLPVKALELRKTYLVEREDNTYILNGKANIINENKNNLTDIINIENIEKDTILEFPYYYYVGYRITIQKDGQIQQIIEPVESENGFLSCNIDQDLENIEIKVEYVGTTITYVSYITSAFCIIIFIAYIIYERKKGKENV